MGKILLLSPCHNIARGGCNTAVKYSPKSRSLLCTKGPDGTLALGAQPSSFSALAQNTEDQKVANRFDLPSEVVFSIPISYLGERGEKKLPLSEKISTALGRIQLYHQHMSFVSLQLKEATQLQLFWCRQWSRTP